VPTTDLSDKFTALETLLATQHTELLTALAPLADIKTGIDSTNTALGTLATALDTQLTGIAGQLTDIFNTVDLLNNNQSLNAQRLIAAIYATACACLAGTPLLPPPIDTTPNTSSDFIRCSRIQYYVDWLQHYIGAVSDYVSSGATIYTSGLDTILQGELSARSISTGDMAAAGGIPESVRDAAVDQIVNSIVVNGRSATAFGLLGISAPDIFQTLIDALFAVTDASSGQAAGYAALDGSSLTDPYLSIVKTLWYTAWFNDMYGTVPVLDTSAFPGNLCAGVTGCVNYVDNDYVYTGDPPGTTFLDHHFLASDEYDYIHIVVSAVTGNATYGYSYVGTIDSNSQSHNGTVDVYLDFAHQGTTDIHFQETTYYAGAAHVLIEQCVGTPPRYDR
jgi:hypothetical protein